MKKRSILNNTAWLLSGRITGNGLSFVFYIALARTFGESGIGDYSFAFALTGLFSLGVNFGLRPLVTRNISKNNKMAELYWGNLILLQCTLAIFFGIALICTILILNYSYDILVFCLLAYTAQAINSIGLGFTAFLDAAESMNLGAIIEVSSKITIVFIGFILILLGVNLQTIMISHIAGSIVYLCLAIYWVRTRYGNLHFSPSMRFIAKTIREALPFAASATIFVIYSRVDVIMIFHFKGSIETGAYTAAYRSIEAAIMIISMAGLAIYPALVKANAIDKQKRDLIFLNSLRWISLLAVIGSITLIITGDKIFLTLFGSEFESSGNLIRLMSILFLISCIKIPLWRLLYATHHEGTNLKLLTISIVINIISNYLLIPHYGAKGAVFASIFSESIQIIGLYIICSRIVHAQYFINAFKLAAIAILVTIIGAIMRHYFFWPITTLVILIAFSTACIMFDLIKKKDRMRLFNAD